MGEIRVIARALARAGKEEQLRNTLAGMLAPTRAERGCRLYELYESNNNGLSVFAKSGRVKMPSIAIQRHRTISN
jgi:quinol monooxygenase YgiN